MKKVVMALFAFTAIENAQAQNTDNELIVNGKFTDNDCTRDWCIFNQANCVKGWTPKPQIQIGQGRVYNSRLGKEKVIELAANTNTCIEQNVKNLVPGVYELKYEYAAREGITLEECRFKVTFQNKELKTITPLNHEINTDIVDIEVSSESDGRIEFCGFGEIKNSYGAIIKSVSLVRKGDLPTHPIEPLPIEVSLKPFTLIEPVPTVCIQPQVLIRPVPLEISPKPLIQPPKIGIFPSFPLLPNTQHPIQNSQSFSFDSHSGKCFQKQYQVGTGSLQLSFDYSLVSDFDVRESAVYITLNGKPIFKVLPCDNGKNVKVKANVVSGTQTFGFCPVGSPNEPNHQLLVQNMVLNQKQCVSYWDNNLIVNGGFEQNQCETDWCIWNRTTGLTKVKAWEPRPEIEVGKGKNYNAAFGNSWVSELDPNVNSCIRQKVALKPGKYSLKFDWAGRSRTKVATDAFDVKLNGRVLKSLSTENAKLNQENIEFKWNEESPESWVQFCGKGKSDGLGAVIDNVKLLTEAVCSKEQIVKY